MSATGKKRIFVICPGRGSYTAESLNYLSVYQESQREFLADLDSWRSERNEPSITELDRATKFSVAKHTKGENASALIYACSYCDFQAIDQNRFEVVAITGNSMGWYLALSMAEALDTRGSFELVNTMGSMMKEGLTGGQIIYPVVDENWRRDKNAVKTVQQCLDNVNSQSEHSVYLSIDLGGYVVLAGEVESLKAVVSQLPVNGDYPFKLVNHGAFHTPMLQEVSTRAFDELSLELFGRPCWPIIDGRGHIWQPHSSSLEELYRYTLGHQVLETYDFTAAVTVGLKEYNPDYVVLLGPGHSLGGPIAQTMIEIDWHGLQSKQDFIERQQQEPLLLSMGIEAQRPLVTGAV